MNAGRVIAAGGVREVLQNHDVIEAYLGNTDAQGEGDPPGLEVH
jgi:ABC-type uncharacterized transport system ATPase subunit